MGERTKSTEHGSHRRGPRLQLTMGLRRSPDTAWQMIGEEAVVMNLAGSRITLFYGAEAQEAFFRAPEEQLDQRD